MKIDLHCHTKYSGDNYLEPEGLIEQAFKKTLDGVCVTEHSSLLDFWVIKRIDELIEEVKKGVANG